MTSRPLAAILFVAGLAASAAAQPQAVALDVFLEQRVAEELAADGTLLSRLGVALDIEIVGDKTLISLVDPATRRAIASTKLDALPADREAAVATVVQIVANLTAQLATTSSTATAVKTALEEERRQREQKEAAEQAYQREAIRFGDMAIVESTGTTTSTHIAAIPYRGDRRLSPPEFFEVIERQDLKDSYETRRTGGYATTLVGLAGTLGGMVYAIRSGMPDLELGNCSGIGPAYEACQAGVDARNEERERDANRARKIGLGVAAAGAIVTFVGIYYVRHASPVSESEARDLADQHNAKLRVKHGLPALARRTPRVHEVVVAPYADEHGGGLALAGRF